MKATGILEYTRDVRKEGPLLARIAFLFVIYAFMAFVTLLFSITLMSIPAFIIFSVLSVSVFFVTRPLLSEKRDYEIVDGSFRIYKVYGKSASKKAFEIELKEFIEVSPYSVDEHVNGVDRVTDLLSDSRSEDAYYAIYEKQGQRCAVIFDGDDKFRAAASFYCRRAYHAW